MKNEKMDKNDNSGRVLGHMLSREELMHVSGGAVHSPGQQTDSWVDTGTCTPKSDDVAANCGGR